jgi:secreted trypsin-like serine protease
MKINHLNRRKKGEQVYLLGIACMAFLISLLLFPGCESNDKKIGTSNDLKTNHIIGGVEPTPGTWPWMARIAWKHKRNLLCGGSLLSRDWVITSKICLNSVVDSSIRVVLGDHDSTIDEPSEQILTIDRKEEHDSIDIVLLHLSSPAEINAYVQPIRPAVNNDGPGLNAIVTGWGHTESSGESDVLFQASLPVRPNSDCNAAPKLSRDLNDNEICAGYLNGSQGACNNDEGGPLAVKRNSGKWEQIGTVLIENFYDPGDTSYCDTYTVFSRTTSYVDWIREHVVDPAVLAAVL